ncbi:unnamed protein product [Linum tenue]|uniref:DUF7054 domain-containing protein n=1 Tax=Linum tenue TaxID=586396 RepID=A0AAV0MYX1_9ROSI|nr:unnamed protein product [Linum tenue]
MTVKGGVVGGGNEKKKEKKKSSKNNKFLVIVNVLGSTGPIRLVVKEDDAVAAVIESTLRAYAKEGRLPGLGSDVTDFVLYSAGDQGSDSQGNSIASYIYIFVISFQETINFMNNAVCDMVLYALYLLSVSY